MAELNFCIKKKNWITIFILFREIKNKFFWFAFIDEICVWRSHWLRNVGKILYYFFFLPEITIMRGGRRRRKNTRRSLCESVSLVERDWVMSEVAPPCLCCSTVCSKKLLKKEPYGVVWPHRLNSALSWGLSMIPMLPPTPRRAWERDTMKPQQKKKIK